MTTLNAQTVSNIPVIVGTATSGSGVSVAIDYTAVFERIAAALESISGNAATANANTVTIATKIGYIEQWIHDLRNLGAGEGIHIAAPFDPFTSIPLYRLLIEEGKLLDTSKNVTIPNQLAAAAKVPVLINQLNELLGIPQYGSGGGPTGGASVNVSDTAPSSANNGDLWYQPSSNVISVYYNSSWMAVSGTGATDPIPPGIPTDLNVTTSFTVLQTGAQVTTLTASWTSPSDVDVQRYDVDLKEGTHGSYISYNTATNLYTWIVKPGINYFVRVRAVDKSNNLGDYCTAVSKTSALDPNAPDPVPSLSCAATYKGIYLSWDNPTNFNVVAVEIWHSTTNNRNVATRLVTVPVSPSSSSAFTHSGLAQNTTHYYWVRSLNTNGLTSTFYPIDAESGVHQTTSVVNVVDDNGNVVFGSDGKIGSTAYVGLDGGNTINLSTVAANSLVPSLNYIGEYSSPPTEIQLGDMWKQNAVYKNSLDGYSYVLTGDPLDWVVYLADGKSFTLTVESTNGTVFRVGGTFTTTLKAHLFKNGAEITELLPATSFRWRRVSYYPQPYPNDDSTWDQAHLTGYKSIVLNISDVEQKATYHCDVIES